jgi:3-methyladenine DNA glycosylase AlkD
MATAKSPGTPNKTKTLTAGTFVTALEQLQSAEEAQKNSRYFRDDTNKDNHMLGVRMKSLFDTAKAFTWMPLEEIEPLLENKYYEVRMGAVSIMDFRAREKKTTATEKKFMFDLYTRRHDRIDNWDLVDRSAPHVVGGYLADKPRSILYKLAKSKNVWERRTAIVSTWFFIRRNELDDTFRIAELLLKDRHDLIQKAVGSWIREAGKRDKKRLLDFLDRHALTMPAAMLYAAVEQFDKLTKEKYLSLKKGMIPAK